MNDEKKNKAQLIKELKSLRGQLAQHIQNKIEYKKAMLGKQDEMDILMERIIRQEKLVAIGQMSANIAHELRNPLGAIKQSIFYLNRLYDLNKLESSNSKVKEHLDLMTTEIDTSDRVISDLLQMTKMEPLKEERLNLRSIILEAVKHCQMNTHVELKILLTPEPFVLWADKLQIRQVFINLFTNAVQAMSQKGLIKIRAIIINEDRKYHIEIQDSGDGIDSKNLDKVFEPLYTCRSKGTGLGLSICKQIVENHGGTIVLRSQINKGTTVIIELPFENNI